jgi:hypothetical protein
VPSHLCLGIILDQHLSWSIHIGHIISKCYGALNALNTLKRNGVGRSIILMSYRAILVPHLTYCMAVWGGCGLGSINRLQVLQNRAIRCIFDLDARESTTQIMAKNRLMNIHQLITFQTGTFAFNNFKNKLLVKVKFNFEIPSSRIRRNSLPIVLPQNHLVLTDTSLYYRLAECWLGLDSQIRKAGTYALFKYELLKNIFI